MYDDITQKEVERFEDMVRVMRDEMITGATEIIEKIFQDDPLLKKRLVSGKDASGVIYDVRKKGWDEFCLQENEFNIAVMKKLSEDFPSSQKVFAGLLPRLSELKNPSEIAKKVKEVCGMYTVGIIPFLYSFSLSNTQSRRSRAGAELETIIYTIYKYLDYPYASQGSVGTEAFENAGLGKKVDSVLPSIEVFKKRRDKSIIGTMKTTLRERWQEVTEEIGATKVPTIHLLTVDEDIPLSKATKMEKHNIKVVTYNFIAEKLQKKEAHNIMSFEDYLFVEIPEKKKYWS